MEPGSAKQRARRLFLEIVDLPDAERAAELDRACGRDDALRAEVEALLRAERAAGAFLSNPTGPGHSSGRSDDSPDASEPAAASAAERAGSQIGRYKLLEQIGEGGMGTIWMAEQREPVRRRVALKIIKLGMDTKQVIARFEAERQALALMDHPNIAKVLDAGATGTGRPYFVMEYIRGIPILEYCDTERLDTRARLDLFARVCHAIQHAHQKGIIHRDIKPTNVLVTLHDGMPVPKVIDFGIAKATNSELTTKTLFTEHRQFIGTPAYMSPEQAEMSGLDIDTRSDIYSLGVLLYELLTGTTPFDTKALLESGFDEMLRVIRHDEPHKPSTRISTLGNTGTRTAQQRRVDVKKLSLLLRGDLDWIVMKCLEKDRTRRYDTANGLASDLRRHLSDEPVSAGPPSTTYRLRKFLKRNFAQVIAASLVLTALLVAIVGASWGLVQNSRARTAAFQRELEDEKQSVVENDRRVRNGEAIRALSKRCEEALRAGDAAKAKVALDAARKRVDEGGAEDQAERLARLAADLDLLNELDAIDQFKWTWAGKAFGGPSEAGVRDHEALLGYGALPEPRPEAPVWSVDDAVARVDSSAIRERIVLVLNWLFSRERDEDCRKGLFEVLHEVDSDVFRDAFRDAVLAHDKEKIEALTRDPRVLEQPPEFTAALGQSAVIPVERRRELMEMAAFRRPSDLALSMALQDAYKDQQPPTTTEQIRWLQAALAADPRSYAAYTNLGIALLALSRVDESDVCHRKAVELAPQSALALANLGVLLEREGKLDEAIAGDRKAMELDPKDATVRFNLGLLLSKQGKTDEAMDCWRECIELDPNYDRVRSYLAEELWKRGRLEEALGHFRKSVEIDPKRGVSWKRLGELLVELGRPEEAIPIFRKYIEVEPGSAYAYSALGDLLRKKGQLDEAIPLYRKAIEIEPKQDWYCGLGIALKLKGQLDEAVVLLRRSVELRPDYAIGLRVLGEYLYEQGQLDEAISWLRRAVELDPKDAKAWMDLGAMLHVKGRLDEAIACHRKAIELDPNDFKSHANLGGSLVRAGRHAEAVPSLRKATELEPTNARCHLDLGMALQNSGDNEAALVELQTSIELDPTDPWAHYGAGLCMQLTRRPNEAIDRYRKALELDPVFAEALCNLGACLFDAGRPSEALPYARRGHELGSKRPGWPYPSAEWVRMAEWSATLEEKLPDLVDGRIEPVDDAERHEYVRLCVAKSLYRTMVELTSEDFTADPRLADDLGSWRRYNAACYAALAGAGRGDDAADLDDDERARLRKQAVDWLRADLALHARKFETGAAEERAAVRDALREWQEETNFDSIRGSDALVSLPTEEREACTRLWADVAALLKKAESAMPADGGR
jgi:tetratricopeptide (TPR) repeat protein